MEKSPMKKSPIGVFSGILNQHRVSKQIGVLHVVAVGSVAIACVEQNDKTKNQV